MSSIAETLGHVRVPGSLRTREERSCEVHLHRGESRRVAVRQGRELAAAALRAPAAADCLSPALDDSAVTTLIIGRQRSNDRVTEGLFDRGVVERARSGDQEAFAKLVHQISDTLLGVARRILRDPTLAEDALQNALLTIWRKLPHLRDADRFEGSAFRILVHACYAEAPRNRRWASTIRVLQTDVASDADDFQMISDRDELGRPFASSRSTSARSSSFITT